MSQLNGKPPVLAKAIHEPRHTRIICIGAGASGLLIAYKLQRSFQNYSLVCYEKNADIGGTWFENRYPGCACDVPSHLYSWTFEPYPKFPSVYASSTSLFDYFTYFCDKYGLRKYCKFNHEVSQAVWKEDTNEWEVVLTLQNGETFTDRCDILINACGFLNEWKWPDIPGLDKFEGTLLHTARWDTEVDLTGKHVGLIGNGSSAIQTLPAILPDVSKVTTFIRSPTWVAPLFGFEQRHYTPEEQETFAKDPDALLQHRKAQELGLANIFAAFEKNGEAQEATRSFMHASMSEKLEKPDLRERLIPNYPFGCRRITPGTGYLEALCSDKVQVVHDTVTEVTKKGCISNGQEYPMDVLICATGFNTTYLPRFPIIGRDGKNMAEEWKDEPQSYFGITVAGFPNYFVFLGPNAPVGQGSVPQAMEIQADYMMRFIDRWQTENILSFEPKQAAVKDYLEYKDLIMDRLTWTSNCRSWYKNNDTGKIIALYPGSLHHFREVMQEPRFEDYEFRTAGNRFWYLGMGYSRTEMDPTCDWAYQIRKEDDAPHHSREARRKVISKSGTVVPKDVGAGISSV